MHLASEIGTEMGEQLAVHMLRELQVNAFVALERVLCKSTCINKIIIVIL